VIEPRIYRAAFVPALLAVVLVMFSLESRPRPLPQGLAADVLFDGEQAASVARRIVAEHPDRRAGTVGDEIVAAEVGRDFESRGLEVEMQELEHDGKELVNVIGRRPGSSRREVVVVAARDAAGVPDAPGSAADTAALREIARVFEGRPSRKTLVLASVDGAALGQLGARRLAEEGLGDPALVDAVLVISSLGASGGQAPSILSWGGGVDRTGLSLYRTVAASLREEVGEPAAMASPIGQLARLAFPLGIGAQGVLLADGYDAVRISGDGERSPEARDAGSSTVDTDRLDALGRATLRTIAALDQGPRPEGRPRAYVTIASQVMPGWVLAVLAAALVLPALVASIDALARSRRRRVAVSPWLVWIAAGAAPLLVGLGLAHALALFGAAPDPPASPVAPDLYPLDAGGLAVLGAVGLAVGLAWLVLRRFARRMDPALSDPESPGAPVAVALVLSAAAAALWLVQPYAALLAVPAVHLWILATLVDPPLPRRLRFGMAFAGLALPALLVVHQLFLLGIGPLGGAWYLLLLLAGGHIGFGAIVVASAFFATLASVVTIVRRDVPSDQGPLDQATTRGPLSYAGPGSLGGTDSALRR
jgi:hypothetical protein